MPSITLIKEIGKGAFGTVYLGNRNGKKCAVKVVQLGGGVPQKIVDDAIKEGKLLENLQHPNIVSCLGCYGAGNNVVISEIHIVMEYCGGGDLHANIKRRRASGHYFLERQVIAWFLDVVRAVEYLHSKDVIHRDIKPLNILKHEDGTIKLGDFGLAKILRSKQDIQASVLGTVIYASPELHLRSVCDARGDMWSMGCTLYELCKLEPAFRNASEMLSLIQKRGTLRPLPSSYSSRTDHLINALLQANPNERPTAAQVRRILEEPSAGSCDPSIGFGNVPKGAPVRQRGPGHTPEVGRQVMVVMGPPLLPGQNIHIKW